MRELTDQKSQIKLNEVFMSTNGVPNYGSTSSTSNGCYAALYENDKRTERDNRDFHGRMCSLEEKYRQMERK